MTEFRCKHVKRRRPCIDASDACYAVEGDLQDDDTMPKHEVDGTCTVSVMDMHSAGSHQPCDWLCATRSSRICMSL